MSEKEKGTTPGKNAIQCVGKEKQPIYFTKGSDSSPATRGTGRTEREKNAKQSLTNKWSSSFPLGVDKKEKKTGIELRGENEEKEVAEATPRKRFKGKLRVSIKEENCVKKEGGEGACIGLQSCCLLRRQSKKQLKQKLKMKGTPRKLLRLISEDHR